MAFCPGSASRSTLVGRGGRGARPAAAALGVPKPPPCARLLRLLVPGVSDHTNPDGVSAACSCMDLNANYPSHLKMVVN